MYYVIGGGKGCYVVIGSTTGETYEPVFNSYNECRHFIGYWQTNFYEKMTCSDAYPLWCDLYIKSDKFIGKCKEWDYSKISLDENKAKCAIS